MAKKSRHQIALEERIEELKIEEQKWTAYAVKLQKEADEKEQAAEGFRRTWGILQSILDSVDSGEQETEEA